MSSHPSDDPDHTLPSPHPASGGAPGPVPARPHSDAEDSEVDATLLKQPGRTRVRGATGAGGMGAAEKGGDGTQSSPAGGTQAGAGGARDESGVGKAPQVFGGRFEVVKVLGEGGMGKVYSVRDRQIEGRAVALKVLLPKFSRNEKFRSLFFQEIRAAQNFVSEHVVQVRDCGQMEDGRLFVTMDLVGGEDLRDLMKRETTLRPRHALEIARQTLLALQSGHERGFVHRDIKPSNIMLTTRVSKTDENPYGVGVRVLDFGIAGLAAELEEGNVAGTPLYMSPEQIQGQRLDARSDLFAVGVVLYEMLAGRRPFEGKTLQQITTSVIETDVAPQIAEMKELPTPIRKILEKALQKNRDQRFQSATEFIEAIEKSSAYKLPSAVPGWVVGALVVTVLVAGAEGYYLWSQTGRMQSLTESNERLQSKVDGAQDDKLKALNDLTLTHNTAVSGKDSAIAAAQAESKRVDALLVEANKTIAAQASELSELKASKGDDYTSLSAELKLQKAQLDSLKAQLDQGEAQRRELAAQKAAADAKITQLDGEILELRRERDQAREQLASANERLNPDALKASRFDDLISTLAKGGGAQARSLYDDAVRERVFERPSQPGTDLVEELIEAERSIGDFIASRAKGGALDIAALLDASGHLTRAKNLRSNFQVAANSWIKLATPGQDPEERVKKLDEYLRALGERVTPEVSALGGYHDQEWSRIGGLGLEQGPEAAVAHAKVFACEHLDELAQAVAAHCDESLAAGGRLDTKKLGGAGFLDGWAAEIESDRNPHDGASAKLLAFAYARRWYDNDDTNDAAFDWSLAGAPRIDSATSDWRAVLRLETEFAKPDCGYPVRAGRRLVYHLQNDSPLRWRTVELQQGGAGAWDLTQNNYRQDALPIGAPESKRVVVRRGVYTIDGASDPLLDIKAVGDSVSVAPFPELTPRTPPPQMGVSQVAMQEHLDALAAGAGPCLVYQRGSVKRWISPEFGLVLEELAGSDVRTELVFATPLR